MSEKYRHIQGIINAKVVKLYYETPHLLTKYTDNLTEKQKKRAREHLKVVIKINETKQY